MCNRMSGAKKIAQMCSLQVGSCNRGLSHTGLTKHHTNTGSGDAISVMSDTDLPYKTCADENACPTGYECIQPACIRAMDPTCLPTIQNATDCAEIKQIQQTSPSGVYSITLPSTQEVQQVCW